MPKACSWINAQKVIDFCTDRSRKSDDSLCGRDKASSCIVLARKAGYKTNNQRQFILTDFFKSFTVLSAVIYSILYLAHATVFVWASGFFYDPADWKEPLGYSIVFLIIILLAACIPTVILTSTVKQVKVNSIKNEESLREDIKYRRSTRFRRVTQTLGVTFSAISMCFIIVSAIIRGVRDKPLSPALTGFGMTCIFLFILYIAIELCWQAFNLRKGTYSIETYYILYRHLFIVCPYMEGHGVLFVEPEKIKEVRDTTIKSIRLPEP